MKASLLLLLACLSLTAQAQQPSLREADRMRLAEAFRLAESVQDSIWAGWGSVPFAVLLVTPEHEFLVRHPRPSDDFTSVGYDSLLQSEVYVRDRVFPPNLEATFPAVGGVWTVVMGLPERTGKSSTFWVLTALHEHFHQLQGAQPDYSEGVAALDLAGGDETGMWMLNYGFPYDREEVVRSFSGYRDALQRALASIGSPDADEQVRRFVTARSHLRQALGDADYRYLSFQLWQEGVARYTEYRVAEAAARLHEPLSAFRALDDYVSYAEAADSLQRSLERDLAELDLPSWKRVAFYPVGAAEALLLDALQPGWQRRYFVDKFYLERYREER